MWHKLLYLLFEKQNNLYELINQYFFFFFLVITMAYGIFKTVLSKSFKSASTLAIIAGSASKK